MTSETPQFFQEPTVGGSPSNFDKVRVIGQSFEGDLVGAIAKFCVFAEHSSDTNYGQDKETK